MTGITPGLRLYSEASATEIIVVKAAAVDVWCAGARMLRAATGATDASEGEIRIELGKRYTDDESGLLVLCTKPGSGPLMADGRELSLLQTKALPSSD